jgi:hypothetical protein
MFLSMVGYALLRVPGARFYQPPLALLCALAFGSREVKGSGQDWRTYLLAGGLGASALLFGLARRDPSRRAWAWAIGIGITLLGATALAAHWALGLDWQASHTAAAAMWCGTYVSWTVVGLVIMLVQLIANAITADDIC